MKQILDIIMGREKVTVIDSLKSEKSDTFIRWKSILLLLIKQSQINLTKGLKEEDIKLILPKFEEYFVNNIVFKQYMSGSDVDMTLVEKQIKFFYNDILRELGINIVEINETQSIENIFEDVSDGLERGKSLTKSNGHSLLESETKTKGYVGAFLLAALTACIEISTVAYIIFNGM